MFPFFPGVYALFVDDEELTFYLDTIVTGVVINPDYFPNLYVNTLPPVLTALKINVIHLPLPTFPIVRESEILLPNLFTYVSETIPNSNINFGLDTQIFPSKITTKPAQSLSPVTQANLTTSVTNPVLLPNLQSNPTPTDSLTPNIKVKSN